MIWFLNLDYDLDIKKSEDRIKNPLHDIEDNVVLQHLNKNNIKSESFKINKKRIKEGVVSYLSNTIKEIKEKKILKERKKNSDSQILYSAVVLDEGSKNNLLSYISQYVDVPFDWKSLGDHMTIAFKEELPPNLKKDLGEMVSLTVKSIGVSDDAIAVEVEGYPSQKEIPHITVAIPPEGSPVNANKIVDWEKVEDQLIVQGKVSEIRT